MKDTSLVMVSYVSKGGAMGSWQNTPTDARYISTNSGTRVL